MLESVLIAVLLTINIEFYEEDGYSLQMSKDFGVTYYEAKNNYETAKRLLDFMEENHGKELNPIWRDWQACRIAVWRTLMNSLDTSNGYWYRINQLKSLREELLPFGLGQYDLWKMRIIPYPVP